MGPALVALSEHSDAGELPHTINSKHLRQPQLLSVEVVSPVWGAWDTGVNSVSNFEGFSLHLIFSDFNRGLAFNRRKEGAQQVQVRAKALWVFCPCSVSCGGLPWPGSGLYVPLWAICLQIHLILTNFSLLKKESPASIKSFLKLLKYVSDMKDVTQLSVS